MGEIDWKFRLYTAANNSRSIKAYKNIQNYCQSYLVSYEIEVIDLTKFPQLAEQDNILAIPVLVKLSPLPIVKMIGDLSDQPKVIKLLQLKNNRPG